MVLIWRGLGILVPIIFFICGFIVHFWIDDTRLGNPVFIGWTSLATAVICIPLGIMTWKGGIKETTDKFGNPVRIKKKHDFFFIPVIFWALILGALGTYMFARPVKSLSASIDKETTEPVTPRYTVHFHNPTGDTLEYYIGNEKEVFSTLMLAPWTTEFVEMDSGAYFIGAFNMATQEVALAMPGAAAVKDPKKSVVSNNTDYSHRRILPAFTPDTSDYDDIWVMLDGQYGVAVLDVTEAYEKNIRDVRWKEKASRVYLPEGDLVQMDLKPAKGHTKMNVVSPNTYLPEQAEKGETVYMLLPFMDMGELTEDYIASEVERLMPE